MGKIYFKEYFIIYNKITGKELFIIEDEKIAKHYCKNHMDVDYKIERIDYDENGELIQTNEIMAL